MKLLKVTRPNNNHVIKNNQMVESWTKSKPVLQNALPKLQDENVGEDSLSSQSIFDQDINSDGYLNSLLLLILTTLNFGIGLGGLDLILSGIAII
jgi:hypothetical protein